MTMITINRTKLQEVITGYKKYFPTHIADEIYKWKAVKHFQDHWDIDAPDFLAMFWEATATFDNLLTSMNHFPRGMVKGMYESEPETVREMFRNLFDENKPLEGRVMAFRNEADRIREQHWPDKMHYQDFNSISTYLWARYPEKYYIYKYSEIRATTRALDSSYVVRKGADVAGFKQAIEFFDLLRAEIQKDPEIRPMLNSVLTSDCYKDENLNCVVVDFDFYVSRFYKPATPAQPVAQKDARVWMYSPGENARKWNECAEKGIMSLGWEELGDLGEYESRDAMREQMRQLYGLDGSYMNDSLATWEFINEIQVGDIVFAKRGRTHIVGRGIVEGEYVFDDSREEYKHIRKVRWTEVGDWDSQGFQAMKTLTEITRYDDYVKRLTILVTGGVVPDEQCNYYWLCANPSVWSMTDWPVGEEQDYTLFNDNGNKRRIFHNFTDAKAGDKVICYEANPTKQITALAIVSRENDGKRIWFEKVESLMTPIPYATIKENADLQKMEFLVNPNGSFFKLTKEEYGVIMDLIRESNKGASHEVTYEKYSREDFLDEVYMSKDDLTDLENLLKNKKNIILQGAPGVGKTFCARRLAYEMMGEKDESRVSLVQFHQNYSYEDFILGYKPSGSDFELQRGIFYKFCISAANNPDKPYFFIIDEINRGNLSKIFGELLMLIEKDYRGEKLTLAYKDEKFFVPKNIYIIGMMNTADRSLAMIDYALRRRFSFYDMRPGFQSEGFKKYQAGLANPRFDRLIEKVEELNRAIAKDESLGSGFELGHSYFCGQKNGVDDAWLHQVINYDIVPMLQEYWFDNRSEVKKWEAELNSIFND